LRSKRSSHNRATSDEGKVDTAPKTKGALDTAQLSKGEQLVWNELVDESQLAPPLQTISTPPKQRHTYKETSLETRPCCEFRLHGSKRDPTSYFWQPDGAVCGQCGFIEVHYCARTLDVTKMLDNCDDLNMADYFGNTILHFLAHASSGPAKFSAILRCIQTGADINTRNTAGETFVHVLKDQFTDFEQCFTMLKLLQSRNFTFEQRDFWGRSAIHAFFDQTLPPRNVPVIHLQLLLGLINVDMNSVDVCGKRLQDTCLRWLAQAHRRTSGLGDKKWIELFPAFVGPKFVNLQFDKRLLREGFDVCKWNGWPILGISTWIDMNGDTLLCSLLRTYPSDASDGVLIRNVRLLLDSGAEIHMRDREDNTALTIATVRGFRQAVELLLKSGANVHCRSDKGRGILSQARSKMHQFQKRNDSARYARILSCINALVDAGAKPKPTQRDEWLTPARAAEEPAIFCPRQIEEEEEEER
jgi:hypothetical protein